eukprot:TRINITY_DN1167_c0_g1_i4.p1 TRINITY_DN1167_c0_g1~~TRINITY_DN1167_c0_g1_i4.p1  ORF type:complete len:443 (+),score=78.19 TRINITY_DN1167_c0_g1_i4:71-1330(+)
MVLALTFRTFVSLVLIAVSSAARRQSDHSRTAIASGSAEDARIGVAVAQQFDEYVADHNRRYASGSAEFELRFSIFQQRVASIQAQNAKVGRLWTASMNEFTDRTDEELAMLRGWNRAGGHGSTTARGAVGALELLAESAENEAPHTLPEAVDWRSLAMASNVPDQGSCGSCWAVATATLLTARHEAQKGRNRSFSAQQLVNCVPNLQECGGSGGCKGATVELAMQYVQSMGLDGEEIEPYVGVDVKCNRKASAAAAASFLARKNKVADVVTTVDGVPRSWQTLSENKALPLLKALLDGPVAVSVGASKWFSYSSGIFDGCEKDTVVNHAVVAFGYGKDDGRHFWTIRNSWGKSWGEDGFMRLLRQATPEAEDSWCGVDHEPGKGIACKPYPDSVKVCGMCAILYDSVAVDFRDSNDAS